MRVLICGDRNWTDREMIREWVQDFNAKCGILRCFGTVIHGAAKGADMIAHEEVLKCEYLRPNAYPADWKKHGKAAGPIRNQQMLEEGHPVQVIAFHDDIENSKGTGHMVRIARAAGIPVEVRSHS